MIYFGLSKLFTIDNFNHEDPVDAITKWSSILTQFSDSMIIHSNKLIQLLKGAGNVSSCSTVSKVSKLSI